MATAPHCYCTLTELKTRIQTPDASDDVRLLAKIRAASIGIDSYTSRRFQPLIEVKYVDYQGTNWIYLEGSDLLAVTSITDGVGRVINYTDGSIILLGGPSLTRGPFGAIRLDPTMTYVTYVRYPERAIQVNGTWGYHENFGNAWLNTGVTLGAALTDTTTTTLTTSLNDVTVYDEIGRPQVVSPGALIQIDTEWMQVVRYPNTTTIVVTRGANGSTAATHLNGATISVFHTMSIINEAAQRYAAWMAKLDDATFGQAGTSARGAKVPTGMPQDVVEDLDSFIKVRL